MHLPVFLDNHLVRVDLSYPERLSEDGLSRFDWWGAGHDTREEGYFIRVSPLAESKDLEAFAWPDPQQADLLEGAKRTIEELWAGILYRAQPGLCAVRAGLVAPRAGAVPDGYGARIAGFAGELLDRITEIQLALIRRYLELGVDGGYFGDDYGAQKGLIMSPASWRQLFKPRLARLFAPFRERGLPVILHSDGQIQKIIPDLIEIGLTALNPVQPEVLEHAWLAENFGGKLAFYGGISTQTVLPGGSPEQVRAGGGALPETAGSAGDGVAAGAFAPDDDGYPDGECAGDDRGVSDVGKNSRVHGHSRNSDL